MFRYIFKYCIVFLIVRLCFGRIHKIKIVNDVRKNIVLNTFGFYKGGVLDVQLIDFTTKPLNKNDMFGFSLYRTLNNDMNPYLDVQQDKCVLKQTLQTEYDTPAIFFTLNLYRKMMTVRCNKEWYSGVHIYKNQVPLTNSKSDFLGDKKLIHRVTRETANVLPDPCGFVLPIFIAERNGISYYNTSFVLHLATENEEGLYNLHFHSCPSYIPDKKVQYNFTIKIIEQNAGGSFLSAKEMPLPGLYCMLALIFFLSGCFWMFLLKQSQYPVFKIHHLMAILVLVKSVSLVFHGVNYHFIDIKGAQIAIWAVSFYVVHTSKEILLFITLMLIGTGWTFIKPTLNARDKCWFIIAIPLQVLANVAEIVLQESEESSQYYRTWQNIFILFDLLCCGCILVPIVWSIRHLRKTSQIDGKEGAKKLKLFKYFFGMIVCYIYVTRIIIYILKVTLSYRYGFLQEMFHEMVTYVCFVIIGYMFRPAADYPYFSTLNDKEEDEALIKNTAVEDAGIVNVDHMSNTVVVEEDDESLLPVKQIE